MRWPAAFLKAGHAAPTLRECAHNSACPTGGWWFRLFEAYPQFADQDCAVAAEAYYKHVPPSPHQRMRPKLEVLRGREPGEDDDE